MTNTEKAEALKQVLALLDGGKAWIREVCARDGVGNQVGSTDDSACCWCLLGGIYHVSGISHPIVMEIARHPLLNRSHGSIPDFNDSASTTFAEIETVLKDTIARLEA